MALFENRERAFEQMFVHDEEARFRALARRNKMLGQWAAERLGLTGDRFNAYVDTIGNSVVTAVVDESLADKIQADFEAGGVNETGDQIREKMSELMAAAVAKVRSTEW